VQVEITAKVYEGYHGGSTYVVTDKELQETVGRDYAYGLPNKNATNDNGNTVTSDHDDIAVPPGS
jgi:hypothetical protein